MTDLPIDPTLYFVLAVHCLTGSIAAIIAQSKGRNLTNWLAIGLLGGTAALIASIVIKPASSSEQNTPPPKV
jgi:hypothetical protein